MNAPRAAFRLAVSRKSPDSTSLETAWVFFHSFGAASDKGTIGQETVCNFMEIQPYLEEHEFR